MALLSSQTMVPVRMGAGVRVVWFGGSTRQSDRAALRVRSSQQHQQPPADQSQSKDEGKRIEADNKEAESNTMALILVPRARLEHNTNNTHNRSRNDLKLVLDALQSHTDRDTNEADTRSGNAIPLVPHPLQRHTDDANTNQQARENTKEEARETREDSVALVLVPRAQVGERNGDNEAEAMAIVLGRLERNSDQEAGEEDAPYGKLEEQADEDGEGGMAFVLGRLERNGDQKAGEEETMALVLAPHVRLEEHADEDGEVDMALVLVRPTAAAVDNGNCGTDDTMALILVPRAQLDQLDNDEAEGEEMALVLVAHPPSDDDSHTSSDKDDGDEDEDEDDGVSETMAMALVPRIQHSNQRGAKHEADDTSGHEDDGVSETMAMVLVPRIQHGNQADVKDEADSSAAPRSGDDVGERRCDSHKAPCVVVVQRSSPGYLAMLVVLLIASSLTLLARLCAPDAAPPGHTFTLDTAAYAPASLRTLCGVEVDLFLALGETWSDADVELVYCRLLQHTLSNPSQHTL